MASSRKYLAVMLATATGSRASPPTVNSIDRESSIR
jgi:hypothetical protein